QIFSGTMETSSEEQLQLENQLRYAVENKELEVYYQPKVSIREHHITSVEALVRWNHPKLGMISPAKFIPLAEETGLIQPIDEWMLMEACRQCKSWIDAGHPPIPVAINLSMLQFQQPDLPETIQHIL